MNIIQMRRGMGKKGSPLPYDAEIEYLCSDGLAYIDTGIIDSDMYKIEIKSYGERGDGFVFGWQDVDLQNTKRFAYLYAGHTNGVVFRTKNVENTINNTFNKKI